MNILYSVLTAQQFTLCAVQYVTRHSSNYIVIKLYYSTIQMVVVG